jgi:O-succinylbenzoate synthase
MVLLINLLTEYVLPCGINDSATVVLRIAPLGSFSQGCWRRAREQAQGFVDVHIKPSGKGFSKGSAHLESNT